MVKPVTVIVPEPDWASVPVIPPGLDVAVYEVIGEPPSLAGAVNETVTELPDTTVAVPIVGAPGVAGPPVRKELRAANIRLIQYLK